MTIFLLGIVFGVSLCNWSYFEFEKTIKITDLVSIIITAGVGLYIAVVIQDQQSTSRSEKDFFIDEVKVCRSYLEQLKSHATSKKFPFDDTKRLFKELNQHIHLIVELLKQSKSCKSVSYGEDSFKRIHRLRDYITKKSPNANREIILNGGEMLHVEAEITKIKKDFYKLILDVNG